MGRFVFAGLPNVTPETPLEKRYKAVLSVLAYVTARGCYFNAKELMPDAPEEDVDQRYITRSNAASNRARALLHRLRPDLEAAFVPDKGAPPSGDVQEALDSLIFELALDFIDEMEKVKEKIGTQVEKGEIGPHEAVKQLNQEGQQLWQQMRGEPGNHGEASVKA